MLFFQVTKEVSLLSRWMAIDLYIREVDSLRFELSTDRCSDKFSRLADEILEKGIYIYASISILSLFFHSYSYVNLKLYCFLPSESSEQDSDRGQSNYLKQQSSSSLPIQLPARAHLPSCIGKVIFFVISCKFAMVKFLNICV